MSAKTILTAVLLLFVVGSIAYMVVRENGPEAAVQNPAGGAATGENTDLPDAAPADAAPEESARHVVVYYFHGDMRCPTCHKLKTYAQQAVEQSFAEELGSGLIEWKTVNVDRPENAHFVNDYQLVTKAVVLSDMSGEKETSWKNLDKIWELVGNQEIYQQYIRDNIRQFVEEEHS